MIFAIFSGLVGTGLSIIIRLELAGPTPQILEGNGQVFNVVISAHAIFMIFFLVMPMSVDEALTISVDGETINDKLVALVAKIGEKISFRRFEKFTKNDDEVFGTYKHMGGKIGVVVVVNDGRNNYDNAHTVFGTKPAWRSITCAYANPNDIKLMTVEILGIMFVNQVSTNQE